MKKIMVHVVVLMMLLALSGCGEKEVSLEEIRTDVEAFTDMPMTSDEITKFEIIKRQTNMDEKEDIVYVHVEAENEDFSAVRNYKLEYILYNEGWMLENYSSYVEGEYYDKTVALHGVDMVEVEEYFAWACDEALYIESGFRESYFGMEKPPIQNNYFDSNVDSYTQTMLLVYEYFIQEVTVNVDYFLNGFIWEPNMYVTETITVKDDINGEWSAFIDVDDNHQFLQDFIVTGKIEIIDNMNCSLDFVKTNPSKLMGKDIVLEGEGKIYIYYDDAGNLTSINLGRTTYNYEFALRPEGLVCESVGGSDKYILSKER